MQNTIFISDELQQIYTMMKHSSSHLTRMISKNLSTGANIEMHLIRCLLPALSQH